MAFLAPSLFPSPVAGIGHSPARGLEALDERLVSGKPGVVLVRVEAGSRRAVVRHIARRLSGMMRVAEAYETHDSSVRSMLTQLGGTVRSFAPADVADHLNELARTHTLALVMPMPRQGSWDEAVLTHLSECGGSQSTLVILVGEEHSTRGDAELFDLSHALTENEKSLWLQTVASEASAMPTRADWRSLDSWWTIAQTVDVPAQGAAVLSAEAHALRENLRLAGREWPLRHLMALGSKEAIAIELVRAGAAEISRAGVSLVGNESAAPATMDRATLVASALECTFADPWARLRAASLLAEAGDSEGADARVSQLLEQAGDPATRSELVSSWFTTISGMEQGARLTLTARAAERAIQSGEAEEAHEWLKEAVRLGANDPRIDLLFGKTLLALGDLVAAEVALRRCISVSRDEELRHACGVELAEVFYLSGRSELASQEATSALASGSAPTRLRARNVLGKLLLLESKWVEADRHFAEDAMEARSANETRAALRARLNRGIALLSRGYLDEARDIFEAVLADAEQAGDAMAKVFALPNLAVVAMQRRAYGEALLLWERTLELHRRCGSRDLAAKAIANLAELRVKLGLFDHAEHAIAFGRRSLGSSMTAARSNQFAEMSARIALGRGNTEGALREVRRALAEGEASGDLRAQSSGHRLLARIALEDGDIDLARRSIERARSLGPTEAGAAEIELLQAYLARAEGRSDAEECATNALASARRANEATDTDDALLEAHTLMATLHAESGDTTLASAHLQQAMAMHNHVASQLTGETKAAYLAKPEIRSLYRLQSQLANVAANPDSLDLPPSTLRSPKKQTPRHIVGDDLNVQSLLSSIRKVARANATVLIRGESGTGKELVAEAIHAASDRANGPLVTVNCAALVETLLLSELFGHEKGAFTGASGRKKGRFELADGGTLFLDEIGDISPRTQVALLRVLQERTFERVGGTTSVKTDARIICATHRDLKAMVERGEFREDLYYRLRQLTLEVPALRARLGDLPKIAANLLGRIAEERNEEPKTLSADALELLTRHRWPGNVRELENVLRAAALFADGATIQASDLIENVDEMRAVASQLSAPRMGTLPPPPSTMSFAPMAAENDGDDPPLPAAEAEATAVAYAQVRQGCVSLSDLKRQIERDCIARALEETGGNITKAAALLGMKRPRLSQLVKQYGLSAYSEGA